jgi:Tol biopolymer transport system component
MALAPGTRLGPYEIQAALGAGGMGEVYRARDTRLDRTVAIKILPETLAADPQFRERFDREARAISSLNHPHICTIHDIGRQAAATGTAQPVDYLVMECLEGETLASRLERGSLPLTEALQVAIQIADALATAHRASVIHRDFKPGNIFLVGKRGSSPTAKLLDFGLAKANTPAVAGAGQSMLPTTPPTLTGHGAILGTFQYMAPEQLEGGEADARTDIFAFGAVLYEMLTGGRAFEGKSHAGLIGAIMHAEPPPLTSVQPLVPRALDRVVRKCLAKDPDDRWQTARDLLDELRWIAEAGEQASARSLSGAASMAVDASVARRALWRRTALFSAAAIVIGAALATGVTWRVTRAPAPRVARLTISTPSTAPLSFDSVLRDIAITPDGARLIYVGVNGTQLFVRALDALEPSVIAKGSLRSPFVSPDGQWVGFFDGNTSLKKVSITGGPTATITVTDSAPRGAAWLPDDTIVFATANPTTGLLRVSANGGTPAVLTRSDLAEGELDHVLPEVLPGGESVLFTITARTGGLEAAQVALLDLQAGTQKVLVRGGSGAHYVPTGHLVYGALGTLRAVAFDLERLEPRGTPVPVVSQVIATSSGAADAVLAADGTLAYVSGGVGAVQRTLVWVDRRGQETPVPVPPRTYVHPRIAPDGRRVVVAANDQENDLWLWDLERSTLTRLTFEPGLDIYPVWTPDGGRLIFGSGRAGPRNVFWQAADGGAAAERLSEGVNQQDPVAVSPDGTRLLVNETNPATGIDLMELELPDSAASTGGASGRAIVPRQLTALVRTSFIERNGIISPDGRWLAYEANDSGRFEIYVRPYPDVNRGLWQVSTGGGTRPLWSRNGQELFYLSPTGALMRVGVERGSAWAAGTPTKLLDEGYFSVPGGNLGRTYDISPDGQRFLMIKAGGANQAPPQIVVVQNWLEELKRLVPVN